MRFISFAKNGVETAGVRLADTVVDLSIAAPRLPGTLQGLIEAGALETAGRLAADAAANAKRPLSAVIPLPVLSSPTRIVSLIQNHAVNGERPASPGLYITVSSRLCAHLEPMLMPRRSAAFDVGVELAIVLKKGGRRITAADALGHVAGYSIFSSGEGLGVPVGSTVAVAKNGDKTAAFGPELVTPDELPAGAAGLAVTLRRNGIAVRNTETQKLCWNVPEIIQMVSTHMTLEAGDVITSGHMTPSLAPDYVRAGEVLEAEIERLGKVVNAVVNEP